MNNLLESQQPNQEELEKHKKVANALLKKLQQKCQEIYEDSDVSYVERVVKTVQADDTDY